ncbi:MAG: amino acid permease [Candidatus Latescibacteria bacterium]|nr:amino acid permease [Candidatus Latescibacterota bacterium]NIO56292.1 amino acid permease [Candidatus Latescibacterota bacterium]
MHPDSNTTQVKREIGALTATSIVIANIVGAGIFTTSGIMAGMLPGSGWILLCWIFGGLIAMAGALCYSELATRMPEEGAEYVYLRKLYHPLLGFLTGWTSFFVGFSAPVAASAIGFSEYLFAGLEQQAIEHAATPLAVKKLTAIVIILLFTIVHYLGIRLGSGVQNFLTGIKIVIVLGLASTGLVIGSGYRSNLSFGNNDSFEWLAIGTTMMLVMFAYSGWNASAYIAGEVKQPRRTLPLSLLAGTITVIVIYFAVNLFIFRSLPYAELKGTIAVVEKASVSTFGNWMGRGLSIMIAVALLSSLSAYTILGPRVYFAMARDRLFFPFAAKVHPRYQVPGRSILLQGAIAAVMVFAGTFEQLLIYLGFTLGIFPWLAVAGLFIARKKHVGDDSAVRVPGYPLVPLFFLASTLGLMVIAYMNRPLESSAAVLTVLAGIPCYFLWVRALKAPRS